MTRPASVIVRSADPAALARARARLAGSPQAAVTADLPLIDGFAARVDPEALADLRRAGVQVVPDQTLSVPPPEPAPPDPVGLLASRDALGIAALWERGLRGTGATIAILDTGLAPHGDLRDRIVAFHDLVDGRKAPYDDNGHGTHVASAAAGDGRGSGGRYAGLAPQAPLVGVKMFDADGNTSASRVVEALQWAVANRERHHIRVVNLSIGAEATLPAREDPLVAAVDRAWSAGLFVVTAAGNKGPRPSTVQTPGIGPTAITVANCDTRGTARREDDRIFPTSGRGPTPHDGLAKPDVAAPGTNIWSCDPDGGYSRQTGTSMAAPMVAGTAALLLQAHPEASPDRLKQALMDTARPVPGEDASAQGRGMIDPAAALAVLDRG